MFFTQDDYKKIQQWLTKNSVKDTEFNEANIPFNGEETITIVQGNQNKKVFLKDLIAQVFNLGISDFVNITDKYDAPNISLEEAIRLIPSRARKEGQVITFLDREDHWHIYQFKGVLNQWNILDQWEDLFDWEKLIIDSILPDEEDLTKSLPDENGNSYLSLKDREYNPEDFSGLGRVILRKNIVEVEDPIYGKVKKNVLYQDMFTQSNTIYEIRYDFDLNGKEITIPEGCVLDFQGGSLSNGGVIGNKTDIIANNIVFKNIFIQGFDNLKILYFDKTCNDDNILQSCIDTNTELDFQGRVFNISKPIIINHNIIIKNTTLVFLTNDSTLAINVENTAQVSSLKLQNVHIDGMNISHTGVHLFYSSNATIENCTFKNFKDTTSSGSRAILCRGSNNVIIANCDFDNIEATPNGILGDSDGACRAIAIQNSKAITIQKCHFNNIISEEDGDAIHFNATYHQDDDNYGDIITSIVENCIFENISRSHIKIQDKGIIVRNNTMLNNKTNEEAIIRIYSSDNSVINNYINYQCAYAISIGLDDDYITKNIIIKDNMIITPGYSYQAVISSNHPLYSLHVINNSFLIKGEESEVASYILYLRNTSEEILFSNNVIKGYSRPVHNIIMRPSSNTQFYNKITINNNILKGVKNSKICNFSNNVLGASYSQINLNGNIIDVPTENFLIAAIRWTYDEDSVINAISETNNSVTNGVFIYNKIGYSNHKPTLKDNTNIGFMYFDINSKKPIYWTGTKWVDATGADV